MRAPTVWGACSNSAIAKYRLPEEILQWDIDGVLEMGVEARTGQMLGRDINISGLLDEGYEAVFPGIRRVGQPFVPGRRKRGRDVAAPAVFCRWICCVPDGTGIRRSPVKTKR